MFSKGIEEGIIDSYNDILNQSLNDGILSPVEFPYFEGDSLYYYFIINFIVNLIAGDYWPNYFENLMQETEDEIRNNSIISDSQNKLLSNKKIKKNSIILKLISKAYDPKV